MGRMYTFMNDNRKRSGSTIEGLTIGARGGGGVGTRKVI